MGKQSFANVKKWHGNTKKFCGNIPVVIFANKVDLINEDSLNESEIQEIVNKLSMLGYYITSTKIVLYKTIKLIHICLFNNPINF